MKKSAVLILLLFTARVSALGQGSCDMTAGQSPAIRGFRLGMTLNQVFELVPEARNDAKVIEALDQNKRQQLPTPLSIHFFGGAPPYDTDPRFQNISYMGLYFFDNQLINLEVQYMGPSWDNVDEFIAKLRENFTLPTIEGWEGSNTSKGIHCKDFVLNISAQSNSGGSISISDTTSAKKMADMKKAALEKNRREFKP
jgi:hypothetical protein